MSSTVTSVPAPVGRIGNPRELDSLDEELKEGDEAREGLNALEIEVIDIFVSIVKMLGIPKSVAEIYGLLFVSPDPLPLDGIVDRLRISKGSVSQGLKLLRAFGGVKTTYVAGDRRDHYVAEIELKMLVAGFMRGEIQPRLENGKQRLSHVDEIREELSADDRRKNFYGVRVRKLKQWHERSQALLPLLSGMLDITGRSEGADS